MSASQTPRRPTFSCRDIFSSLFLAYTEASSHTVRDLGDLFDVSLTVTAIRGNHMKLGGSAASGSADRLESAYLRPHPIGMHLDDGAVQRHRFQVGAYDPLTLQLVEHPVMHR